MEHEMPYLLGIQELETIVRTFNPAIKNFERGESILRKDVRENRKNKTNKYSVEYTAGIGYFASFCGRYFDGGYGRDSKDGRCIY